MNAQLQSHTNPLAWFQHWLSAPDDRVLARGGRLAELGSGDSLQLDNPQQLQLVCLKGMLWITHEGVPDDNVIERGQRYVTQVSTRMRVCAVGAARLHIAPRQR